MDDEVIDLRGLKCPLPALMTRRALNRASPGAVVTVTTDDPMAPVDIPHMCHSNGFEVVDLKRQGDEARIIVRKPE